MKVPAVLMADASGLLLLLSAERSPQLAPSPPSGPSPLTAFLAAGNSLELALPSPVPPTQDRASLAGSSEHAVLVVAASTPTLPCVAGSDDDSSERLGSIERGSSAEFAGDGLPLCSENAELVALRPPPPPGPRSGPREARLSGEKQLLQEARSHRQPCSWRRPRLMGRREGKGACRGRSSQSSCLRR